MALPIGAGENGEELGGEIQWLFRDWRKKRRSSGNGGRGGEGFDKEEEREEGLRWVVDTTDNGNGFGFSHHLLLCWGIGWMRKEEDHPILQFMRMDCIWI